jgi:biopolymer transport protein ExbB/TolQ
LIYSKQTTDKADQINLGAKPLPRKESKNDKKKGSFNFLYWFVVIVLSAWMVYLNLNVFFEYSEVKEEYNKVKEEYEMKQEILNQKVQEYERLKKRVDEYEQDNNQ